MIIDITGIILYDFHNVNSSFLHEQFISPFKSRRKTSSFNFKKKNIFTNHEGTINNLRHTRGKYFIKALDTKPQCASRHGSVLFSALVFPGINLLLAGLWRVHATWKMLPVA